MDWVDGDTFHALGLPVYRRTAGDSALVKRRAGMAHVRYSPAHPAAEPGWLAGRGAARTVWLASEQPGTAEGADRGCLLGAFDTELEPDAAIGWHLHPTSAELYLLLAGALRIRAGRSAEEAEEFDLAPGDLHRLPPGLGHAALAGPAGARIVVVETGRQPWDG